MKNIIYIVSFPLNNKGGDRVATADKITALRNNGNSVVVVSANQFFYKMFVPLALFMNELTSFFKVIFAPSGTIVLNRGFVGLAGIVASKLRGFKFCREVHADLVEESGLVTSFNFKSKILKMLGYYLRFLDRFSDVMIFNHPNLQNFYIKNDLIKNKSFWSYNGVSKDKINKNNLTSKNHNLNDKPYLIFVGNVAKWHGLDLALDVYSSSEELMTRYDFIVIGPIKDEDQLFFANYRLAGVKFLGKMQNAEVQKWISESVGCFLPLNDIRVSPGSPLKLYEYLSHGKPVITQQNTIGYSDVVEHYSAGLCINFKNPEHSAESILDFYANSLAVDSDDIKEKLNKDGTWEHVMTRWLDSIVSMDK